MKFWKLTVLDNYFVLRKGTRVGWDAEIPVRSRQGIIIIVIISIIIISSSNIIIITIDICIYI